MFQTEVALIYDAIMLFKLGVKDLVNKKGSYTKALPTAKCNGKKSLESEHLGTELTKTMLKDVSVSSLPKNIDDSDEANASRSSFLWGVWMLSRTLVLKQP
ncbi:glutamate receptor [Tropilaelaps mercedesae]|uniref:Glutamate receptor n=1 Tax=Tropilaelaps mercedesae TaxID=418985 RepID=A0A1V9X0T1_9ACAR|nr:glutamate receptor [Tropilaelaps mercedesae]